MSGNNTVMQSALKPVHQGLLLDTGNLRPEIVRSWQCCGSPSVLPDSPCFPSLHMEMQLLGTVVLHCTEMAHTRFFTRHN